MVSEYVSYIYKSIAVSAMSDHYKKMKRLNLLHDKRLEEADNIVQYIYDHYTDPVSQFNPPHMSTADATVTGYVIPNGSHVLLSRHGLGRDPKVWDEPLKFKLEWHIIDPVTEVKLTVLDLRFISFSTGGVDVLGVALGSAMTILLLTRLLQAFDWTIPPGEECIELAESADSLFLAKPLHLLAKPHSLN